MRGRYSIFLLSLALLFCVPSLVSADEFRLLSLEACEAALRESIPVSLRLIVFYFLYLCTIWAVNFLMIKNIGAIPVQRRAAAKNISFANILLAAGDTAFFIGWMFVYFYTAQDAPATKLLDPRKIYLILRLGIFSTSITMSCYYLLLGYYYKNKFNPGKTKIFLTIVLSFFVLRILLHYYPNNIWFSMMLDPGTKNPSAWLRNTPLFIYGLLVVGLCLSLAVRKFKSGENTKEWLGIIVAMVALVVSFIFYGADVFFAHIIPRSYIWIIYAVKTIAYVVALFAFWYSEFYLGKK